MLTVRWNWEKLVGSLDHECSVPQTLITNPVPSSLIHPGCPLWQIVVCKPIQEYLIKKHCILSVASVQTEEQVLKKIKTTTIKITTSERINSTPDGMRASSQFQ